MMFAKIKIRFIALSMCALFVLLTAIIACMNIINYRLIIQEADMTLSIMADNRGIFPDYVEKKFPIYMSQETLYEARYFSVALNENRELLNLDTSRIIEVDAQKAYEYAIDIVENNTEKGFVGKYRYINQEENELQRIIFLDCGMRLYSFQSFLKISILIGIAGYLVFFAVIVFFSGRIMRPVAESYEKQRRFITDAGHEIKTPLAIIKADVDVLEFDLGENEWLEDIQKQTKRLAGLTNDLVYLSRMEEEEKDMQMIEFPFSDVMTETVSSFQSLARTQNKNLQSRISPMLSLTGNEKAIRQLVNILLDNALKYSPEHGLIFVDAQKQGRHILLTVFNSTQEPIPGEKLDMIFERFFRLDASRSTITGGYGIGLSVAKAIVSAHNGKICAMSKEENSLKIIVTLPLSSMRTTEKTHKNFSAFKERQRNYSDP